MSRFYNSILFGIGVIAMMIVFMVLYLRYTAPDITKASKSVNLNISKKARIVEYYDSHAESQSEGEYWAVIVLTPAQTQDIIRQVKVNKQWHQLPMPGTLNEYFKDHGVENGRSLPIPNRGYFFLKCRSREANYDKVERQLGSSYTIAIFDPQLRRIYVWTCDN